jgi:tetratricopeptide (TPR) repeat protein
VFFNGSRNRVCLSAIWVLGLALLITSRHTPTPAADATGRPQKDQDAPELALREAVSREISGGDSQSYTLRLSQNQSFRLLITRGDLKVSVSLQDPAAQQLGEFSSQRYGPIRVTAVARVAGTYRLRVSSQEADGVKGNYSLLLEEVREATEQDREGAAATSAFYEAERLRARWTEDSTRAAIQKYGEALNGWRTAACRREAGEALERIGDAYFTLSEYDQARRYYEEMFASGRRVPDRLTQARALNNIGYVYSYTGEDRQALAHFQAALARLKGGRVATLADEEVRVKARALSNAGEVYYSRGELKRALALFGEALGLWTEAGDRWGQALARLNLGYAYGDSGETQKASEQFEQAQSLWRAVGDARGEALALSAVGGFHAFSGRKRRALETYQQALNLFRRMGDRQGEAVALNGLARTYEEINELQTALDNYSQALAIFQKNRSTQFEAATQYCVGNIYRWMQQPGPALERYKQSITLSREVGKQRIEAYAMVQVATIHASQKDPRRALAQYNRALSLYRRIGDRLGQAMVLNSIGDTYYAGADARQALNYYRRALPLYQASKDRSGEAATFYNIARATRGFEGPEAALVSIESAVEIIETLRTQIASPAFRSSYFSSVRKYYGLYIDLLMQMHKARPEAGFAAEAFLTSEKARARVLLETMAETEADLRQGIDPELLKRERSLQQLLSTKALYLSRLLSEGGKEGESEEVAREIRRLEVEYQDVQALIRERSPRYANVTQPQPLRLPDVQELLGKETLLLEYALGEERSYLWLVSSDGVTSAELPGRATLEKAANDFYNILRARAPVPGEGEDERQARVADADRKYRQSASELSRLLLGSVAERLGNKRLLIVPDGALQYVPFDALPIPPTAGLYGERAGADAAGDAGLRPPIIVEHEISNLPSASTLLAIRHEQGSAQPANGIVAVLADPVFEADDPRLKPAATQTAMALAGTGAKADSDDAPAGRGGIENAARLPFTAREAENILSLVPDGMGMIATGFDANLTTAKSPQLGRYEVVHFATHGVFDNEQPQMSGLLLSLVDESGNPENGFLHLHDIYSLHLPVKMVVLSGCDTALGKDVSGEGLVGLTHAFMYAGSKSVLASLWKVDDKATSELMGLFYNGLLKDGLPPAAALRAAKIAMWERQPSLPPYFWAAFILEGEFSQKIGGGSPAPTLLSKLTPLAFLVPALLFIGWGALRASRGRRRPSSPES